MLLLSVNMLEIGNKRSCYFENITIEVLNAMALMNNGSLNKVIYETVHEVLHKAMAGEVNARNIKRVGEVHGKARIKDIIKRYKR